MDADELRRHRRNLGWNTALLGDIPILVVQYIWGASGWDPIMQALAAVGWRPLEQIGHVTDTLIIGADHMEADWIRSGDPDTYEGLVGIEAWVETALTRGEVVVLCAPGILSRSERLGRIIFEGALAAIAPARAAGAGSHRGGMP